MDCLSFTSPPLLLALYSHVQVTDHTSDHTSRLKGPLKPSIIAPTLVFRRQTLSPACTPARPSPHLMIKAHHHPCDYMHTWVCTVLLSHHRASLLAQIAPFWLLNSGRCPFVTGKTTVCTGSQEDGASVPVCSTQQEWGRTAVRVCPCHFPLWSWEGGTKDHSYFKIKGMGVPERMSNHQQRFIPPQYKP